MYAVFTCVLFSGYSKSHMVGSSISKIFDGILVDQMGDAMENIFSPHLSGFRKHHSSQCHCP